MPLIIKKYCDSNLNFTFLLFLILFLCFSVPTINAQKFSTAGFYSIENSPRKVFNFNLAWRFYKGENPNAKNIDFDDRSWKQANLPHGIEILEENASGGRNYQGVVWYRKQFPLKQINHKKYFIYFEAVMGKCEIWMNGEKIAEHFGGYLPFAIDITKHINKNGTSNIIAVKANNENDTLYPPGKSQNKLDFSYLGGIYRDTYLIETNNIHISLTELSKQVAGGGVFIGTINTDGKGSAKIGIRTEIINTSSDSQRITLKSTLENADFKALKTISKTTILKPNQSKQINKELKVKDVHLWHPNDPYLHYVKTEIFVNGKLTDALRTRFGIRLFEMRGADGLFINKKYFSSKIIGVNKHQDYVYVGNALPNSSHWRDVKLLREGGSRIIRVGHYPQDPAFYDACDEFGMLTSTANPGWHFFNFKNPIFEQRLYENSKNLVRKDRNRPSIIFWETALNETPKQPTHVMHNMHKIAHEEFPFPGMYTVTDHEEAKKAGLDIYYHGNDKNINSFNREYGDGGEVDNWYAQNAFTRVRMEWGEKALLGQALKQASTLNDRYKTEKIRLGGAMWCGIDHQRGYHPDPFLGGHLDVFRMPRYVYFLYKSQYDAHYKINGIQTGPMIFNTNELTQISPKDVVIFSNCDEIKLYWVDKLIATKKPSNDDIYKNLPHAPFIFKNAFNFKSTKWLGRKKNRNFEMKAEGFINGKLVVTNVKKYPLRTEKLKLSIADENLKLVADGSDFVPVRATVVDENGTKKILSSEYVYFKVEGPAEVIGGTYNHANPVKTTLGIATVLVRASTKAGKIKITAYSNGLKPDTIDFESVPSNQIFVFDQKYFEESKKDQNESIIIQQKTEKNKLPINVEQLQKQLERLKLEMIGKEQEVMDLRSKLQ